MNIQGLIDYCNVLKESKNRIINCIDVDGIIDKIKQLDEREKVKVPQVVADWIRKCKTFKPFAVSLSFALQPSVWEANRLSNECINWLLDANNQDLFARAWIFGYEVEEEKRYRISMPKARNHMNHAQFLCEKDDKIFWCGEWYPFKTKFTRKQLEDAGFGWVFDCEGVEVEEVKDEHTGTN